MTRQAWARPASHLARELATAGVSRERIRAEVVAWVGQEDWRVNAVVHAWADKIAADAFSADPALRPTKFRPRASTSDGRTPSAPDAMRPSDLLSDWQSYLSRTAGIAEKRASMFEAVNALQQGLGLWPEMDEPGNAAAILARLGWTPDRIEQVLGLDEEEAAA